jgi:hypothetical protein
MLKWFKNKQPAEPAPEPAVATPPKKGKELYELQAELLAQVIDTKKFEALRETPIEAVNGVVHLRQFEIEIMCQVLNEQSHGEMIVYTLGFYIKIKGEAVFYEELATFADNPFLAMLEGVTAFSNCFLNGFLSAFFGHHEPDYELHGRPGDRFHLTYSQLQVQGAFKDDPSISDTTLVNILYPRIKDFFSQLAGQNGYTFKEYYWVKMYLSRQEGNHFTGECRFNNQEWRQGLIDLTNHDYAQWAPGDDFLAKKQFIFIKKCKQ